MIDPRMFLGIGGPTPQQQMLPPGFRPPAPVGAPPMGGQPQGGQMGIPSMGGMGSLAGMFGPRPSTSGAEMGAAENDGLGAAVAGIANIPQNAAGGYDQPPMPTDIGSGMGGGGNFMSWFRGLW
jgi:hypothetical protein